MRLGARLEIRLAEKQRAMLQRAAEKRGWATAFFVREAALEAARRALKGEHPENEPTEPAGA